MVLVVILYNIEDKIKLTVGIYTNNANRRLELVENPDRVIYDSLILFEKDAKGNYITEKNTTCEEYYIEARYVYIRLTDKGRTEVVIKTFN